MGTIKQDISRFRRYIGRVVALPAIALALFAALLTWQIFNLLQAYHWVDVSDRTIAQANDTLNLLIDEETGERGYLVGGDRLFLEPYNQARGHIGTAFDRLSYLVGDYAPQQAHVKELRRLHALWEQNAATEMRLRDANSTSAAFRAYFNQARGKILMDAMRAHVAGLVGISEKRRDNRVDHATTAAIVAVAAVLGGALVLGALLGIHTLGQIRRLSDEYEAALRSEQKNAELLSATLLSIGDAVLVTDARAGITQMNAVAEKLTGWKTAEVVGQPSSTVFNILNESTRAPVESPVDRVIREGVIVGLANHTVLIHRDGHDVPIDDSGSPIRDGEGNLIGTVLVFRDITDRKRLEGEREQALMLAEQRAVELAAQYNKEHRIAESLQSSLLAKPAPNAFTNVEIETMYRPAWNEAQVGGDFYDLFALDDGKVAMVVGDVSGKGLEAAAKTAEIKFTLRAYLREHPHAYSAMMRLNEFLCEAQTLSNEPHAYFLCLSLAIFDTLTGEVSVGTAGSEPALIVRSNLDVSESNSNGMPLGVMSKAEYHSPSYKMQQGDMLVITTDGITEARRAGGEFLGLDGLSDILRRCDRAGSLAEVGAAILTQAASYAGGTLSDDACVLLARRL